MSFIRTGVTSYANAQVGGKYVWGGTGSGGYDCSGLTYKAYESQGVSIPRVAQDQYNASTKISTNQLQAGDLVFFSDTGSVNNVTHVGIYNGDGTYTHAANSTRGIVTDKLNTSGSYFVGAGTFVGSSSASTGSTSSTTQGGLTFQGLASLGAATATGGSAGGSIVAITPETSEILGQTGGLVQQVSWKEKILILLGYIVKVLTLILVFALAAVFFTKAFDIKIGKTGGLV